MGSTYTIDLYGTDRVQMEAAADAAFDEVRRLDDLLSNYKPDSEWSQVNRTRRAGPVKISPELFELLAACVEYSRRERRGVRYHGRPADEGLGILQGIRPPAPPAGSAGGADQGRLPAIHLDPAAQTVLVRPRREWRWIPGGSAKGTQSTAWWTF